MTKYPISPAVVYDIEVYPNLLLVGFQLPTGSVYQYTQDDLPQLVEALDWLKLHKYTIVGYNSRKYDDLVLSEFLRDPTMQCAYEMSVQLIQSMIQPWDIENTIWSVDLMPIIPGWNSLKKLGICMGHKLLQELPFPYDQPLTYEEARVIKAYNINDLIITRKLLNEVSRELELRQILSDNYDIDLRSKGEAQIAETVLLYESGGNKSQLRREAQATLETIDHVVVDPPSWWHALPKDDYPTLQEIATKAETIFGRHIPMTPGGRLSAAALSDSLYFGDKFYTLGIGGLHSVDGAGAYVPKADQMLVDIDVASYYPAIMLTQHLGPRHWGEEFQRVFKSIVDQRLEAKRAGRKTEADVLKIVINSTYGKTADFFSTLFDPKVTASVTVTGQIALLVLIAMLEHRGIRTVSANTDGITALLQLDREDLMRQTVTEWEQLTGFEMEYTHYKKLLQLDVNNYIAVKDDNSLKTKGRFGAPPIGKYDLRHTPQFNIVALALQRYFQFNIPFESTILACEDLNQFLLTQQVTGDWTTSWKGHQLGKNLRWYKSLSSRAAPIYRHPGPTAKGNEGVVQNGEHAIPVDVLPDKMPRDINYVWYISKAYEYAKELTRAKEYGMNDLASDLESNFGLHPVVLEVEAIGKSRAKPRYGSVDFNSIDVDKQIIGVTTGGGVLAQVIGQSTIGLFKVSKDYPSRTRPLVKRDHGFELIYGAAVALPEDFFITGLRAEEDFDMYYTPAELKKVNRHKDVIL